MLMITHCFFKRGNPLRRSRQVKNLGRFEVSNPSKALDRERWGARFRAAILRTWGRPAILSRKISPTTVPLNPQLYGGSGIRAGLQFPPLAPLNYACR